MTLIQLRTLISIAETNSFTLAADRLFITASAVSHQMRDLEEELNIALFDRSTRPPTLNGHGHAVVERGRALIQQFDTLVELAKSPGEIGGQLMLGCVSGVSSALIPEALARLRASHPAVRVSIEEGLSEALSHRVYRRELDAAIITALPETDPELKSILITEEAMMVVAPRDCPYSKWQDVLSSYPFIRLNRRAGMGRVIDREVRANRINVEEAMELDSSAAVVGMARAGLGAGVVPEGRLRYATEDEVKVMPFGNPPIHRQVVLVERRNNPRSDLSQLVYDEVRRITKEKSNSS
ncbi:MAG: LysR family transcriptional regulator [Acidiferrobacterales bacterium]|nr:LysR family transcriptional regulator [Acidiferrobacterales bacterium]